jgi:hypothetical protein
MQVIKADTIDAPELVVCIPIVQDEFGFLYARSAVVGYICQSGPF